MVGLGVQPGRRESSLRHSVLARKGLGDSALRRRPRRHRHPDAPPFGGVSLLRLFVIALRIRLHKIHRR
jgi:hypothetical protein